MLEVYSEEKPITFQMTIKPFNAKGHLDLCKKKKKKIIKICTLKVILLSVLHEERSK